MASKPRKTPTNVAAETVAADAKTKSSAKPVKTAPAKTPATAKTAAPADTAPASTFGKGRAPLDGKYVVDETNLARVKRGFTLEFLEKAQVLHKGSRGKGFMLSALFAEFPYKTRSQLMDCFYACTERGVFQAA